MHFVSNVDMHQRFLALGASQEFQPVCRRHGLHCKVCPRPTLGSGRISRVGAYATNSLAVSSSTPHRPVPTVSFACRPPHLSLPPTPSQLPEAVGQGQGVDRIECYDGLKIPGKPRSPLQQLAC
ncbi:hypothetical protein BJV74DRAFT_841078 [Russula compacta]|nr:hypothetical protein BJV74DRAFT_841078 [Russula compacta]